MSSGLTLEPIGDTLRRRSGLPPSSGGVVIKAVDPGSAAQNAGLQAGDVLLELNRQPFANPTQFAELYRRAQGKVLLLVVRDGSTMYLLLEKSSLFERVIAYPPAFHALQQLLIPIPVPKERRAILTRAAEARLFHDIDHGDSTDFPYSYTVGGVEYLCFAACPDDLLHRVYANPGKPSRSWYDDLRGDFDVVYDPANPIAHAPADPNLGGMRKHAWFVAKTAVPVTCIGELAGVREKAEALLAKMKSEPRYRLRQLGLPTAVWIVEDALRELDRQL